MTDRQTLKALLATDKATLNDIIRMKIEMGGKTFTADWIDAPKSEDDGKRMMIQLSKTAEILLRRILNSRVRVGPKSFMMYDSMVEHLIWEEARRLKVTDEDLEARG